MKDKLYEEYGYKIDYLIYKKDYICFDSNDSKYMLFKTNLGETELEYLNSVVKYLDNFAIFFHEIIPNKKGYILEFGHEKYVLIKPRIINNRPITLEEIMKVSSIMVRNESRNIIEEKIDFLEQYLANYENLDLGNVNYFIGLSENAIALFNIVGNRNKNYVNHKRIYYNEPAIDFYNPLNIIIDYRSRDLAEYAKSLFINGNDQVIEYLKYLNYNDWVTYFARVIFPTYYFDMVDFAIKKGIKIDKKRINNLANSFEKMLRNLYLYISNIINIPSIEWLGNINNF